jgi:hypothetical protein
MTLDDPDNVYILNQSKDEVQSPSFIYNTGTSNDGINPQHQKEFLRIKKKVKGSSGDYFGVISTTRNLDMQSQDFITGSESVHIPPVARSPGKNTSIH